MASSEKEKRCLYEVLGLSRDCSVDEIRSAYKKLALQRHPDKLVKSGVSEAEATAQFQELVNAYEVLSDPKERSWYDSHRSQILFSSAGSSFSNSSSSVCVPDLFSYFNNSVYSGYSDSGKGFYKVYGDVFDKIYQNEINFAKRLGLPLPKEAPLMGNLECYYTQVTAFYNYWLGFVTLMDFCWVDQYDVMAGPNRKSRRLMEEENKKLRKKARREFNDTVRGLAEFVKKRDKRVIDMQVKRNEEIEKKKEEERQRKKELERLKAERLRNYEEPEWAKVDEFEDEEEEIIEETPRKGGGQELYCVACGKKFKSEKQWKNHEQSKKHKEKVAELREAFHNEDEEYEDLEVDGVKEELEDGIDAEESGLVSAEDDELDELRDHLASTLEIPEDDDDRFIYDNGNSKVGVHPEMGSDDNEENILEDMVSGYKNQKGVGLTQKPKRASKKIQVEIDSDDMDFLEHDSMKGSRRNRGRRKQRGQVQEEAVESEPSEVNGEPENENNDNAKETTVDSTIVTESKSRRDKLDKGRKLLKPDVEKKGSGKQNSSLKSKEPTKGRKNKAANKGSSNTCDTCGEEFESRNKLHKHLGDSGHASLKYK
ncbi:OLC1v1012149C1 [Oldenlandia corymbosa var. corymbosa]|uniref:OLC1v1012149C1 n=1 Tax=Oldenlandia corymbosa var. corymbosa TaxID=529605 RepID=A0AAV1DXH1_OLDCO|nr:OLC1v1012149C1 [Oldenlandia corymbosa var. corymbosa]